MINTRSQRSLAFLKMEQWIAEHLESDLRVEASHPDESRGSNLHRRSPRRRLEETTDRIATIAEDCGFFDEEQMRSAFVRVLGVPPRRCRKHIAST